MDQPLARAKVYRNIELRQQWFGLEPFDAIALGVLLLMVRVLNRHSLGWNLLVVVVAFVALRVLKRGKPDGYTTSLLRFYVIRRPFFSAAAADVEGRQHAFPSIRATSSHRDDHGATATKGVRP